MAKPELGTKRVCPTTGRKFYDLNKDPIVSPFTGEIIPRSLFEPQLKAQRSAPADSDENEQDDTGAELVSLDEVEASEVPETIADDDDADIDTGDSDDTFLEEEEEGDDDVSDLIDSDIEDDDEI